jgi:hypothetical protein
MISNAAYAHSSETPYVLPLPFWMYLYACAATLVLTFALLGSFLKDKGGASSVRMWDVHMSKQWALAGNWTVALLRVGAVGCLVLTVVAGIFGTPDPATNISMNLFWVLFLLGFTYVTAVTGNLYELINPWRTSIEWAQEFGFKRKKVRLAYPDWLGYYPALLFYGALIWLEIFVLPKPASLAIALIVYSVITFTGVALFGKTVWFRYGEFFGVFFRLVATLAPVQYVLAPDRQSLRMQLRLPLTGAIKEHPDHVSLVLFVLFMLSSTTYDGMHQTYVWQSLFWKHVPALFTTDMVKDQSTLMNWYALYQRAGLFLSPFLYTGIFVLVLAWAKAATKTVLPLRTLAVQFAFSLIPIAFVYNVTHYYTLFVGQSRNFLWLASDPLGLGWNLFGLGAQELSPPLNMSIVWHTQVALILVGHIASVYIAHVVALQTFRSRWQAVVGQLPLLLLMVIYTGIGLWVLSLATIPAGTGPA